jgi:hypothetical protein
VEYGVACQCEDANFTLAFLAEDVSLIRGEHGSIECCSRSSVAIGCDFCPGDPGRSEFFYYRSSAVRYYSRCCIEAAMLLVVIWWPILGRLDD